MKYNENRNKNICSVILLYPQKHFRFFFFLAFVVSGFFLMLLFSCVAFECCLVGHFNMGVYGDLPTCRASLKWPWKELFVFVGAASKQRKHETWKGPV